MPSDMVTSIPPMLPLKWREAVQQLLDAAEKPRSDVAKALDVKPPTVLRWLETNPKKDQRTPNETDVRRINESVAKLIGIPEALDYLFMIASHDDLIQTTTDNDALRALKALAIGLRALRNEFTIGPNELSALLFKQDEDNAIRLCWTVAFMRGARLTLQLTGGITKLSPYDEFLFIAKKLGFEIDKFVRTDRDAQLARVRDRAALTVDRMLSKSILPPATRVELRRSMLLSIGDVQRQSVKTVDDDFAKVVMSSVSELSTPATSEAP